LLQIFDRMWTKDIFDVKR